MEQKLKICHRCKKPKKLWRSNPPTCSDCDAIIKAEAKANGPKEYKAPPTPINKRSDKGEKLNALYLIQNRVYLKNNPVCKANLPGCKKKADQVHHKRGRGQYLLDETTWLPVCDPCHKWVEAHPTKAKELGLSENRLDKY